jgi:Amidase
MRKIFKRQSNAGIGLPDVSGAPSRPHSRCRVHGHCRLGRRRSSSRMAQYAGLRLRYRDEAPAAHGRPSADHRLSSGNARAGDDPRPDPGGARWGRCPDGTGGAAPGATHRRDAGRRHQQGEAAARFFTRRSYTTGFSLAGTPAVAVPCGFSASGLPIGVQIAGRPFDEATVLRAAWAYEQATPRRRPLLD